MELAPVGGLAVEFNFDNFAFTGETVDRKTVHFNGVDGDVGG